MKSALWMFLYGALFCILLIGCNVPSSKFTNQREMSFASLPPIPSAKGRVVLVFDQSPVSWKIFPMVVTIDHKLVLEAKSIRSFAVIDVEPGRRELRFAWGPAGTDQDPLAFEMKAGATGYFFCKGIGGYLDQPEIGELPKTIRVTRLSPEEGTRVLGAREDRDER